MVLTPLFGLSCHLSDAGNFILTIMPDTPIIVLPVKIACEEKNHHCYSNTKITFRKKTLLQLLLLDVAVVGCVVASFWAAPVSAAAVG